MHRLDLVNWSAHTNGRGTFKVSGGVLGYVPCTSLIGMAVINLADCGVLGAVAEPRGLRLAEVGNLRIKFAHHDVWSR
jgi:hypothetical protein